METVEQLFEVWKDIPGYEGLYQVSNLGNVRSCDHFVDTHHNGRRLVKGKVLKPVKNRPDEEYLKYCLSKNGKHYNMFAHKAVALAFLPNPDNLKEINHKDENPKNNSLLNIEWCSHKTNINFGTRSIRSGEKHKVMVVQYDLNGNKLCVFQSIKEAASVTGTKSSNIVHCCKGRRLSAGGYKWKYEPV